MAYLRLTLKSILACMILALPGLSTAAPPNTFAPGDPILASEVNANFSDLDTRVTTLQNSTTVFPNFSEYDPPFSADGAPKNVVVLSNSDPDTGDTIYGVRSKYANSTEQVSIDGVLTIRPLIAHYATVVTDSGSNITIINDWIDTPDTINYDNYNVEQSTYDTSGTVKTVTDDTIRELWDLCNGDGSAVLCIGQGVLSSDGSHQYFSDSSRIQTTMGPYTVNGMTFPDVRFLAYTNGSSRIGARGVGEVFRENADESSRLLIFYRSNGVSGGSLAGTPFDTGQPLDGLFF
jgi:hypothetical protein